MNSLRSKNESRSIKLAQKNSTIVGQNKRSVSCGRSGIQLTMRNSSFIATKAQIRNIERYGSRNKTLEQRALFPFQKKHLERKLLTNSTRRNRQQNFTVLYQNLENFVKPQNIGSKVIQRKSEETEQKVKEMESHVTILKKHMRILEDKQMKTKKKKEYLKQYIEINNQTEELYNNYSILSREVLKQKIVENGEFEKYINATQDKEKALTDTHLSISHQRMKMKLLHETLKKHNKDYEVTLLKTKKMVCLVIKEGNVT